MWCPFRVDAEGIRQSNIYKLLVIRQNDNEVSVDRMDVTMAMKFIHILGYRHVKYIHVQYNHIKLKIYNTKYTTIIRFGCACW